MTAITETLTAGRALPLFLTRDRKYRVGSALFLFSVVAYLITNHFHFFPPHELARSWMDMTIPFLPGSIWIYLSEGLFFSAIYISSNDLSNLNKFIYSYFALQITSGLIFWAWPTTYPRDLFPLPQHINSLTAYVFAWVRNTDTPANCCPSLHVSSCYLASFLYIDEQRKYLPLFFAWATMIALSTLTTKQHYVIDVVTGFLMAVVHYWIFHRWMQYRKGT